MCWNMCDMHGAHIEGGETYWTVIYVTQCGRRNSVTKKEVGHYQGLVTTATRQALQECTGLDNNVFHQYPTHKQ